MNWSTHNQLSGMASTVRTFFWFYFPFVCYESSQGKTAAPSLSDSSGHYRWLCGCECETVSDCVRRFVSPNVGHITPCEMFILPNDDLLVKWCGQNSRGRRTVKDWKRTMQYDRIPGWVFKPKTICKQEVSVTYCYESVTWKMDMLCHRNILEFSYSVRI